MNGTQTKEGWTVDQGLAAQYAAQAGVDPDLAADAGEEVWDVLKSLRDATETADPKRQAKLVKRTKARLAKANLSCHGELVQHIEAKLLALQGRGGDTELAHVTPGEVIVPPQLQTPEVMAALQKAAHAAGIDMSQYTAGSQASRVNPETGLEEFTDDREVMGPIRTMIHRFVYDRNGQNPIGLPPVRYQAPVAPSINTMVHPFVYNADGTLKSDQPEASAYDPPSLHDKPPAAEAIEPSDPDHQFRPPLPSFDPYVELGASLLPPPHGTAIGMGLALRDTINNGASAYHNFDQGNYSGALDDIGKGAISAVGLVPGAYQIGKGYGLYRGGFIDEVVQDVDRFNDGLTATDPIRHPDKYYNPFR